jgi:NTP pyrophosphatase (non-canonical NTP hydrolase)
MTDSFLTFAELRQANISRQAEWDSENRITLIFRAAELAEEVGETIGIIKKLTREQMGLRGSRTSVERLSEEIADVAIVLDLLAMQAGIDLAEAVVTKFNTRSRQLGFKTLLGD